MRAEGYASFGMQHHTELRKANEAKGVSKGFGVLLAKTWYWYNTWVDEVRKHCKENMEAYRWPTSTRI